MILSIDQWAEQFVPVKNHIDQNSSFDGEMFETFGEELDFVINQNPLCIWTYRDDDNGKPCIVNGYHLVNRIGYFITEKPFTEAADIYVNLD